jgi:putative SOS response-associated peptidase YedK
MLFDYLEQADFPPRQHVTPNSPMAIVRMEQGKRHFALVRWGFIPSWTKEIKPGKPLINARGETVAEKPSFRNAFKRRRCLIPADGFYEWQGDIPGKKQAWFIERRDKGLMAFAGLWEHWMGSDGSELETGVIITTDANPQVGTFHPRSPVVIEPEDFETWLAGDVEDALKLIHPAPDEYWTLDKTVVTRNAPPPKPAQGSLL